MRLSPQGLFCVASVVAGPMCVACGGGGAALEASSTTPFTEEHAAVFEDGVDFVDDPTVLEGRWRDEWLEDIEQRVRLADGVYLVFIRTVRTDLDLSGRTTYRLVAETESSLFGAPPGDEISLDVTQGERGFGTVDGNERRLLDGRFVAFVKYYVAEDGRVLPHWHLSPATEGVILRVQGLIDRRSR